MTENKVTETVVLRPTQSETRLFVSNFSYTLSTPWSLFTAAASAAIEVLLILFLATSHDACGQ